MENIFPQVVIIYIYKLVSRTDIVFVFHIFHTELSSLKTNILRLFYHIFSPHGENRNRSGPHPPQKLQKLLNTGGPLFTTPKKPLKKTPCRALINASRCQRRNAKGSGASAKRFNKIRNLRSSARWYQRADP